jgi:tripartite-type tricarboxylate transporter receptor subunit TctC
MKNLLVMMAAALLGLACATAGAQDYPNRPINVIVPYSPGTGMDLIARTVGPKLSQRLGQPVVIDNRPGASGNIGAEMVARAAPDGYTLLIGANTMLIAASLYKKVPFDPVKDFTPVSQAAFGTLMLVASNRSGIQSVADLIARAKAHPGTINYGSPGVGTPHHMAMELFKDLTGTDLVHVPYKGSGGVITDIVSGQIDVMFLPVHVASPYIRSGRLRALAVGSSKRHPNLPDVATLAELGIKGAEVDMWYPILLPRGAPPAIVTRLNAEFRAILALPDVKASLAAEGMDAASSSPAELGDLMQREFERWAVIIRRNHISAD